MVSLDVVSKAVTVQLCFKQLDILKIPLQILCNMYHLLIQFILQCVFFNHARRCSIKVWLVLLSICNDIFRQRQKHGQKICFNTLAL